MTCPPGVPAGVYAAHSIHCFVIAFYRMSGQKSSRRKAARSVRERNKLEAKYPALKVAADDR